MWKCWKRTADLKSSIDQRGICTGLRQTFIANASAVLKFSFRTFCLWLDFALWYRVLIWAYSSLSSQSFDHKKPPVCLWKNALKMGNWNGRHACFLALTTCHFQQQHAITWSVWPSSGCRGPPCKCWMWNRNPVISCCRKQFTPVSSHPLPKPRRHFLIWSAGWCSICSLLVNMPPFAELLQVKKSLEGAAKNLWSILWENK